MKTFSQFLFEASTTQRLKLAAAKLVAKHKESADKIIEGMSETWYNLIIGF